MFLPQNIARLYAIYATLAVLLLASLMPPMQNADEAAHAFRADQISHAGWQGVLLPDGEFGGTVDTGLIELAKGTLALPGHPGTKATPSMFVPRAWGQPALAGFPNTAINPPLFYLPASLTARLTRARGTSLPHAFVLMRVATGLVSVVIGSAAIALAGDAAIWLFTILLLPMSLALGAAVSQDAPMLAFAALATAVYLRLCKPGSARPVLAYAAMCLLLAAIAMARPPYVAFAVLAATAPVNPRVRAAGVAFILACALGWTWRNAGYLPMPVREGGIVSPHAQMIALLTHFWRVPVLILNTLRENGDNLARGFIGELGWLDTDIPAFYHRIAWCGLALAALCTWRIQRPPRRIWEALAILASIAGLGLAQYMTWTVIGGPIVQGLQGRYFLVPAILSVILWSNAELPAGRFWRWPILLLLLFPIVTIPVTVNAVFLRYYL